MDIRKRYAYVFGVSTILIIISLNMMLSSKYYVHNELPSPNYLQINNTAWYANIDMIIPWHGEQRNYINGTDIRRERDNKELPYLLYSIAKNAPWVHKVWILVNKDNVPTYTVDMPESIKSRTCIIDRCTFMPNGTCPTRNGFSVGAFVHHLPDLSEWFMIVEDDIFLGRAVTPSHFYEDGKPFVWTKKPTWGFFQGQEFHQLYKDPSVVSFPTPRSACPCPHYWYPQLKSVFVSMEQQYPEFYQFLVNHTKGRYSSLAKGPSDEENSQEEDYFGWMNWELLRTGKGVYKNINSKRYEWWDEVEISKEGFDKAIKYKPIFMNVNDRFSKNEETYKEEIGWFHAAMKTLFSIDATNKNWFFLEQSLQNRMHSSQNQTPIHPSQWQYLDPIQPTSTNVTLDANVLVYHRVPKTSSQTMLYLIKELAKTNQFKTHYKEVRLGDKKQYVAVLTKDVPFDPDLHNYYWTKYNKVPTAHFNMVRDPVERLISGYYYIRKSRWASRKANTMLDPSDGELPPTSWFNKTFDECVMSQDTDCKKGVEFTTRICGALQMTIFCGGQAECNNSTSKAALQLAKYNVEKRFNVVGVLERMNTSLLVMEQFLPRWFQGVTKLYANKKPHNNKVPHPKVSRTIKEMVRKNIFNEVEFYEFVNQRLSLQENLLITNDKM